MDDDQRALLLFLKGIFLPNIIARTLVAKAHHSGMFHYHIAKVSKSYLDWFYVAIEHVYCLMNIRALSNIKRLKVW